MRSIILPTKAKLTLPIFLEFVELKTKVASVFPLLTGLLWYAYRHGQLNVGNTVLFSLAVLSFDLTTTAINNTMDYKKALDMAYKEEDNVIGRHQLDYDQMVQIIFNLLGLSTILSLVLVWRTDWLLLPMGMLCFLIGIFYTFGPMPLSRLPLGEVFSGVTMGFGIFFLANYVQVPNYFVRSGWLDGFFSLQVNVWPLAEVALISLPLVALIANIMLANNICDYEQDLRNDRYTLVHYLTPTWSVRLYQILSALPWVSLLLAVLLGLLPWWSLVICSAMPLHLKSIKRFSSKQVKRETFIESIKSFVLWSGLYVLVLLLAGLTV